jgi:hypothetical protein
VRQVVVDGQAMTMWVSRPLAAIGVVGQRFRAPPESAARCAVPGALRRLVAQAVGSGLGSALGGSTAPLESDETVMAKVLPERAAALWS